MIKDTWGCLLTSEKPSNCVSVTEVDDWEIPTIFAPDKVDFK